MKSKWLVGIAAWLASGVVLASACGGRDNLWRVRSGVPSTYERELIDQLSLGPKSSFLDNSPGNDAFEASSFFLDHRRLRFESELGRFEFILPPRFSRRESDIRYLTGKPSEDDSMPDHYAENMAPILHEMIWEGAIKVPKRFLPYLGAVKKLLLQVIAIRRSDSIGEWMMTKPGSRRSTKHCAE